MRIYPAIKAQMGDWNYYIVRMKMREIAQEVHLAHDIYEDKTLSDAVQRTLRKRRVKNEIVGFLSRREDRFFSSIVVAAMDGEPAWHPVTMDTRVVPEIFSSSRTLNDSFGVLSFGDEPKYYALDGQHRVAAIKLLVNGEVDDQPPAGFEEDMLSVLIVLREEHDVPQGEWMRRYRRLFSSLNRYARATDTDTNIIMDEDDLFAILTRRLITEHKFFQAPGRERESFKVKTEGKNLRTGASHFTTLQTLYAITEILLKTRERENRGWKDWSSHNKTVTGPDKQIRPDEESIDKYYDELSKYWDAILEAIPDLKIHPSNMRVHDIESVAHFPGEHMDHFLFWPIGQELFARLVRCQLDKEFSEGGYSEIGKMKTALLPLAQISWNLHSAPWRHFILVKLSNDWRMRSEDRKRVIEVSYRIIRWCINLDNLSDDDLNDLYNEWDELLYGEYEEGEPEKMWGEIKDIRKQIINNF